MKGVVSGVVHVPAEPELSYCLCHGIKGFVSDVVHVIRPSRCLQDLSSLIPCAMV